jgi:hypothetical protein
MADDAAASVRHANRLGGRRIIKKKHCRRRD